MVNLIIREHLLPEKVMCSSSTVCQIFNDKQKKAVVIDEEENKIDIDDVTKETLSKYLCAKFSEQNIRRYKRVDIYWPVDILKVEFFKGFSMKRYLPYVNFWICILQKVKSIRVSIFKTDMNSLNFLSIISLYTLRFLLLFMALSLFARCRFFHHTNTLHSTKTFVETRF